MDVKEFFYRYYRHDSGPRNIGMRDIHNGSD